MRRERAANRGERAINKGPSDMLERFQLSRAHSSCSWCLSACGLLEASGSGQSKPLQTPCGSRMFTAGNERKGQRGPRPGSPRFGSRDMTNSPWGLGGWSTNAVDRLGALAGAGAGAACPRHAGRRPRSWAPPAAAPSPDRGAALPGLGRVMASGAAERRDVVAQGRQLTLERAQDLGRRALERQGMIDDLEKCGGAGVSRRLADRRRC